MHTDDDYGILGADAVHKYARYVGICFSNRLQVQLNPENPDSYYKNVAVEILNDPAYGIIYFSQEDAGKVKLFRRTIFYDSSIYKTWSHMNL